MLTKRNENYTLFGLLFIPLFVLGCRSDHDLSKDKNDNEVVLKRREQLVISNDDSSQKDILKLEKAWGYQKSDSIYAKVDLDNLIIKAGKNSDNFHDKKKLSILRMKDDFLNFEQIVLDSSFLQHKRFKSLYKSLINGRTTIREYLGNFESTFSTANLYLKVDANFSTNQPSNLWDALGITVPPVEYNIEVIFNTDPYLPSSADKFPKIILAQGFMHEIIHAEMFRKLMSIPYNRYTNPNGVTREEHGKFLISIMNEYPGIWDYYSRYEWNTTTPSDAQHEQMAEHYISTMSQALAEYDNNKYPIAFYEALSWNGLIETTAWENLTTIEQKSILSVIQYAYRNEPFDD